MRKKNEYLNPRLHLSILLILSVLSVFSTACTKKKTDIEPAIKVGNPALPGVKPHSRLLIKQFQEKAKSLAREKPGYDGAEPSGNSVMVLNLLRFHELTTIDPPNGVGRLQE